MGGENKTLLDVLPHLLICIKNKIWKDFVSSIDHTDQYCVWTKDSLQGHSLYQIMLNKLRVTVAYIIHKTKPLMYKTNYILRHNNNSLNDLQENF